MVTVTLLFSFAVCPQILGGEVITDFIRGDVNRDQRVNLTDAIHILRMIADLPHEPVPCADAADVDNDGGITIRDAIYLLNFLFLGGRQPPYPFPYPGIDPGWDQLACGDAG